MHAVSRDVSMLVATLSLASLFWGSCVTREAKLLRGGKGRHAACALMTAETIGLVLLVVSLMLGYGVAALVLSRIADQGVLVLAYAIASHKVLARSFSYKRARQMTRYWLGVAASNIVGWTDDYGGDSSTAEAY